MLRAVADKYYGHQLDVHHVITGIGSRCSGDIDLASAKGRALDVVIDCVLHFPSSRRSIWSEPE